jgi:uncharacterized protein YdiU (UPF0061 family)
MSAAEPLLPLSNGYARLPNGCYARIEPTPVREPRLVRLNRPLAVQLGLDADFLSSEPGIEILGGNRVPDGAEPLAMVYAGHQFGQWVPRLGDGRAVLLGDVVDREGRNREIQLKGAGPTPFSRRGDGRAALGPVLREYVVSEAMAGLGIPTTRALAMVSTGEPVYRERVEPGAILTRVAASHLRVGTFEYFHHRGETESIRALADYACARLYEEAAEADDPYRVLLAGVVSRQADLIARWMLVGFIHGVMNTDNCAISGETIDYGPCAFMDHYDPEQVFSSIDRGGRYAYHQQPGIGHWNLCRFAETLLPLLAVDEESAVAVAREALEGFPARFEASYRSGLLRKIGIREAREGDIELARGLLVLMAEQRADFTLTFRRLSDPPESDGPGARTLFAEPAAFDRWEARWNERVSAEGSSAAERSRAMRAENPAFIPRNHRVQAAIDAAEGGVLGPLEELLEVVTQPYVDHEALSEYERPPEAHEVVRETFCGT